MGASSKTVFRLRVPIGYEFLKSTTDGEKKSTTEGEKKRKHHRRSLRLGHLKQKGSFIAGFCKRFGVRIASSCSCKWGSLLMKRVKGFYRSFRTEVKEARPAMKEVNNSSAVFDPPAVKNVFFFQVNHYISLLIDLMIIFFFNFIYFSSSHLDVDGLHLTDLV